MIVTSNKPFSAWGEIFGDDMAATAMIDRLIHHAEILSLKGDSYRLRGKDLDARPTRQPSSPDPRRPTAPPAFRSARLRLAPRKAGASPTVRWHTFQPAQLGHFSTGVDTNRRQLPSIRLAGHDARRHMQPRVPIERKPSLSWHRLARRSDGTLSVIPSDRENPNV